MSTELEPQPFQPLRNHKGDERSKQPSTEKKRKRVAQVRETSPTKRRRHKEIVPAVRLDKNHSTELRERQGETVAQKPPKKSRKPHPQDHLTESNTITPQSTHSPFRLRKSTLYLPIYPISGAYPVQGLCADHLSPLLLSYYPPLEGVLLSYGNVLLSHELPSNLPLSQKDQPPTATSEQAYANVIESYGPYYTHLTADFLLFAPQRGDVLEGHVILQNEGNVGLICYNFFSASIERKRLPKTWRWVGQSNGNSPGRKYKRRRKGSEDRDCSNEDEDSVVEMLDPSSDPPAVEGHFLTSKHPPTGLTGTIQFRVVRIEKARNADREQGLLSIEGTLLTEEDEKRLVEEERDKMRRADEERGLRQRRVGWMSGALHSGVRSEEER